MPNQIDNLKQKKMILIKKPNAMASDYSKSSLFNDGSNLFCNPPNGYLKFNACGTFAMKY